MLFILEIWLNKKINMCLFINLFQLDNILCEIIIYLKQSSEMWGKYLTAGLL